MVFMGNSCFKFQWKLTLIYTLYHPPTYMHDYTYHNYHTNQHHHQPITTSHINNCNVFFFFVLLQISIIFYVEVHVYQKCWYTFHGIYNIDNNFKLACWSKPKWEYWVQNFWNTILAKIEMRILSLKF